VTFTATAQGTAPLAYQWFFDGTALAVPSTNPNFVINAAALANTGDYHVVVTNAVSVAGVESDPPLKLKVLNGKPEITLQPISQTLLAGEPLVLDTAANGKPVLKYQWKRNGTAIVGATAAHYATTAAVAGTTGNGGLYIVDVSNALTPKAVSTPAHIVVVGNTLKLLPVAKAATATMTAEVSAATTTVITYKWFKDGVDMTTLPADARITGITTKVLKITNAALADTAVYTCQVTASGLSKTGSPIDLRVFDKAPQLVKPVTLPDGIIGGTYDFTVPVASDTTRTPTVYAATGLPPGLKINAANGNIYGKPTATKTTDYQVRITVTNPKGKDEQYPTLLKVLALPANLVGVYTGPVERQTVLNGNLGGRFDLLVTGTATFTGKLTMGSAAAYAFAGTLDIDVDGVLPPSATVIVKRTGTPLPPPLTVTFTLDPATGVLSAGAITDGATTTTFTGWRQIWNATTAPATRFLGLYNFALDIPAALAGDATIPQGNGYGAFTVAKDGKLAIAGKTADGETLTVGTFVGPNGQVMMFQPMYANTPKGSFAGHMLIDNKDTDDTLDNTIGAPPVEYLDQGDPPEGEDPPPPIALPNYPVTWLRPAFTAATARTYKAGFGPIELTPAGARYVAPVAGTTTVPGFVILQLPEGGADNAELVFTEGGLQFAAATPNNDPDVTLTIAKGNKVTVTAPVGNPAKVVMTPTATTGVFKGTFVLSQPNPRTVAPLTPATVTRTVTFQGLIIKDLDGNYRGYGYFLVAQLPNNTTLVANTPILSGQVLLQKK
ncbi:MAG: putative Ig domain-containing protein, partial [Prosthecobacter sp.]|nr:putative Ig domain-containing protein [Prosthecobacter sp.]